MGPHHAKEEHFDDHLALTKSGGFLKINAIRIFFNEEWYFLI